MTWIFFMSRLKYMSVLDPPSRFEECRFLAVSRSSNTADYHSPPHFSSIINYMMRDAG